MKICWDMLEEVLLHEDGDFRKGHTVYIEIDHCERCGDNFITPKNRPSNFCSRSCALSGKNHPQYGKKFSSTWKRKLSIVAKKRFAINKNNPNYKGGVEKLGIPLFDTFASQLDYVEDVKLIVKNGFKLLGVKCSYCGKWFVPTLIAVRGRLAALKQDPKGRTYGEGRFYCSENCKQACPIYCKRKYPRGFKHASPREIDPYLRQLVLKRNNWTCQICGKTIKETQLHVHHMDPATQNPMFQNDMDSCITLCKDCHKMVHKQYGCRYVDLRCKTN